MVIMSSPMDTNMDTKKEADNQRIIQKNNEEILRKSKGICIAFLKASVNGEFKPEISYHLHFLITRLSEENVLVTCLDTGGIISSAFTPKQTKEGLGSIGIECTQEKSPEQFKGEIASMVNELCHEFLGHLFRSIDSNLKTPQEALLLCKMGNDYWKKFNEIKEESFYRLMKEEYYSQTKSFPTDCFNEFKNNYITINPQLTEYREKKVAS